MLGGESVHLTQSLRFGAVIGVQAAVEAGDPVRVRVGEITAVEDVAGLRERQEDGSETGDADSAVSK